MPLLGLLPAVPDPASRLLETLARTRSVAGATDYDRGGATGRLEAAVSTRRDDGTVVLREEGRWVGEEASLPVRDVTRWRRAGPRAVDVAHLRRGRDEPTPLGRVRRAGPGSWATSSPHVCGDDRYRARARLLGSAVTLVWLVRGSAKAGRVRRTYRPTTSAPCPGPGAGIGSALAGGGRPRQDPLAAGPRGNR